MTVKRGFSFTRVRAKPSAMTRACLVLCGALSLAAVLGGCGVPPPDRLEITPPTPIRATEQGSQYTLKAHAYRGIVHHD